MITISKKMTNILILFIALFSISSIVAYTINIPVTTKNEDSDDDRNHLEKLADLLSTDLLDEDSKETSSSKEKNIEAKQETFNLDYPSTTGKNVPEEFVEKTRRDSPSNGKGPSMTEEIETLKYTNFEKDSERNENLEDSAANIFNSYKYSENYTNSINEVLNNKSIDSIRKIYRENKRKFKKSKHSKNQKDNLTNSDNEKIEDEQNSHSENNFSEANEPKNILYENLKSLYDFPLFKDILEEHFKLHPEMNYTLSDKNVSLIGKIIKRIKESKENLANKEKFDAEKSDILIRNFDNKKTWIDYLLKSPAMGMLITPFEKGISLVSAVGKYLNQLFQEIIDRILTTILYEMVFFASYFNVEYILNFVMEFFSSLFKIQDQLNFVKGEPLQMSVDNELNFYQEQFLEEPHVHACRNRIAEMHHQKLSNNESLVTWKDPNYQKYLKTGENDEFSWIDAKNECLQMCMDTVSLTTPVETLKLLNHLQKLNLTGVWTSGRKCNSEECVNDSKLQPLDRNGWVWTGARQMVNPSILVETERWNNNSTKEFKDQNCLAIVKDPENDAYHYITANCDDKYSLICQETLALKVYIDDYYKNYTIS